MKEQLKGFLADLGIQVRDFGTNSTDAVDYPDFAHAVAKAVAENRSKPGSSLTAQASERDDRK